MTSATTPIRTITSQSDTRIVPNSSATTSSVSTNPPTVSLRSETASRKSSDDEIAAVGSGSGSGVISGTGAASRGSPVSGLSIGLPVPGSSMGTAALATMPISCSPVSGSSNGSPVCGSISGTASGAVVSTVAELAEGGVTLMFLPWPQNRAPDHSSDHLYPLTRWRAARQARSHCRSPAATHYGPEWGRDRRE